MTVFGITGGSGAGKSDVSAVFRDLGVYVADADKAAHAVTAPGGECIKEIEDCFGFAALNTDGSLNRKRLGSIVFSDPKKLVKLNEITHKYISEHIKKELRAHGRDFSAVDGAVIIGSPVRGMCKFLVSVLADYDLRIERICRRDGISADAAENRLKSQPDDKIYIENSRYLIYNNAGRDALRREVMSVFERIKTEAYQN